jgi:tetratricopeptide (TPR) repeat protein
MYSKRTRAVTATNYRTRIRRKRIILAIAVLVAGGAITAAVIPFSSKIKSGTGNQRKELLRLWGDGSYEEVFKRCQDALDSRPMDYFLLTMHGFSAYQLGVSRVNNLDAAFYFEECVQSLRKAKLLKNAATDGRLYYVLGKAYWYKGESFSYLSVRYLEKARELSAYSAADIPEFLGMAYASMGDYRNSVAALSEALNPQGEGGEGRDTDNSMSGPLLLHIARSYLALEEFEAARAYLQRCLEVSPDSNVILQARLLLAEVLKSAGDTGGAVKQLSDILAESGDSAEVHYRLGELYAQQGENARARAEWRQAIRADPAHARARSRLSL